MNNTDYGTLLFTFAGRINRAPFWTGILIVLALEIVVVSMMLTINTWPIVGVGIILLLLLIWPAYALTVKRFHDRGKSGWWVLIWFIPAIGPLWVFIECGFLAGDDFTNEYGPDPLDSGAQ
ncbi:MAG: DUF805 domain-containing protein [Acidimicrobiia bacterium]